MNKLYILSQYPPASRFSRSLYLYRSDLFLLTLR
jgi:hypothetical protein